MCKRQFWQKLRERSLGHFVDTRQLLEDLRRSGCSVAPATKARLLEQVSNIIKKTVSGPKLRLALIKSELEPIKHRIACMDWQSEVTERSRKNISISGHFTTVTLEEDRFKQLKRMLLDNCCVPGLQDGRGS